MDVENLIQSFARDMKTPITFTFKPENLNDAVTEQQWNIATSPYFTGSHNIVGAGLTIEDAFKDFSQQVTAYYEKRLQSVSEAQAAARDKLNKIKRLTVI